MEEGSHDELMTYRGIYYGLVQAQYKFLGDAV
jgi:ATP-binding cassette subfamily B protein